MALQLEVGAILEGKITGVKKFGAFVALPERTTAGLWWRSWQNCRMAVTTSGSGSPAIWRVPAGSWEAVPQDRQ